MAELAANEHEELVAELPNLEKMSAEARLLAARKRRLSQLDRFKSSVKQEEFFPPIVKANKGRSLRFQDSITLIEAAARNGAEEVQQLLDRGVSADLQNQDGLSALHQAVIEDCNDVVRVLVKGGATLNIKDADLWTPLHAAVACENYELVMFLVEQGADMVAINADGNMPIDLNDDNENQEIEVFLDEKMTEKGFTKEELENIRNAVPEEMMLDLRDCVQKGRDLDIKDDLGATAMHIAAANGYEEVIEYLLDNGAIIDVKDKDGWQPIHAAACWGQDLSIEILYNHGADLDARTDNNETPFDVTEDDDLLEIMKELKESGRKIAKSVKRSQSNSSRTLCVRRLSLIDKHQTSKNDAVNEGIFFQKPEVMNVMNNADNADDDEEQRPDSVKVKLEPKPLSDKVVTSAAFVPPVRPPSVNRSSTGERPPSVDCSSTGERPPSVNLSSTGELPKPQETAAAKPVAGSKEKNAHTFESETPREEVVGQESITVTIGDRKKTGDAKSRASGEPSLVSYQKISTHLSGAPVAEPEIDSPMRKKESSLSLHTENEAESRNKAVSNAVEHKNTADGTRNGKLPVRDGTTVNKKCCSIL